MLRSPYRSMTLPDSTKKRDRLLGVLTDVENSAASVKSAAQKVVESATFSEGLARHLRPVIEGLPDDTSLPDSEWTNLTDAYGAHAKTWLDLAGWGSTASASTASVTLTTAVSPVFTSYVIKTTPSLDAFHSFLLRPGLIDEVRAAMHEFDLDKAHEASRSALDLLDEAHAALVRPPTASPSPAAVLILARESTQAAIATLLRRRPRQDAAGRPADKIASIGDQCGKDGLEPAHFERIGRDFTTILSQLSESKQAALELKEIERLFHEVLRFFRALLESLDCSKLRSDRAIRL